MAWCLTWPSARASGSWSSAITTAMSRGLRRAGFHKTCRTALCATTPPLVLTHVPLLKIPSGAVSVHGHLHRAAGPTDRHVNVSVEHTNYAPVGLTYVLELARRRREPRVATLRLDSP